MLILPRCHECDRYTSSNGNLNKSFDMTLNSRSNCCKLMDQYVVASMANLESLKKGFNEMKQAVEKIMVRDQFTAKCTSNLLDKLG